MQFGTLLTSCSMNLVFSVADATVREKQYFGWLSYLHGAGFMLALMRLSSRITPASQQQQYSWIDSQT